jgi:uncharacterized membrane protein (DUF2068 family)
VGFYVRNFAYRAMQETQGSPPKREGRPPLSAGFLAVIVFKYLKAIGFLLLGATVLHVAHLSRRDPTLQLAELLGVNAHRFGIERIQEVFEEFTPGQVQALGYASAFVGLVFVAEGTFLAARIWWATYFTIFLTALGIPVEIREIAKSPHEARGYVLFAINLAILAFVWARRNEFRMERA